MYKIGRKLFEVEAIAIMQIGWGLWTALGSNQ